MAKLSPVQIAAACKAAGWPESELETCIMVAIAESSGNTDATNSNTNGSTDYGLFQINSVHEAILKTGDWKNPVHNAKFALTVWNNAGKKWTPWVAYNSGRYRTYKAQGLAGTLALKAFTAAGKTPADILKMSVSDIPVIGGPIDAANKAQDAIAQISTVMKFLTDSHTWLRAGMFTGGVILIVIAILALVGKNAPIKEIVSAIPVGRTVKGVKGVAASAAASTGKAAAESA